MKEKEAGENTYRQFHVILITLHQNRQTSKRTTNAKKPVIMDIMNISQTASWVSTYRFAGSV